MFDGIPYRNGPVARYAGRHVPEPDSKIGTAVSEPRYLKTDLDKWRIKWQWAAQTEDCFLNVIDALEGNYQAAETMWHNYEKKLADFRGKVKNDIASLEATAKAAAMAAARIKDAHGKAIEALCSAEMCAAITNAERLADALERIAALKSHKLALTIVESIPGS